MTGADRPAIWVIHVLEAKDKWPVWLQNLFHVKFSFSVR